MDISDVGLRAKAGLCHAATAYVLARRRQSLADPRRSLMSAGWFPVRFADV
ncbi:MAG: hypothetical protein K0S06_3145 [Microvirga sp.]|jgi:hypothetical protein|nr:hypothetical protein [Microvirga sp.]